MEKYIFDDLIDENSESDEDIKIEITDYKNGIPYTHIYSVPYKTNFYNEKRLICFSVINNEQCQYGENCTYAHSNVEQKIDSDKKFIYQVILDKKLMNFFSLTNPKTEEIYKNLLFLTHVCNDCFSKKCTGGYNCRNGVCDISLKICKNDLLTGGCSNKLSDIYIDESLLEKLNDNEFESCTYKGCINGHHLTDRNLLPYYKYVHQKENSKKNKYKSFRYIDINPLNRLFKTDYYQFNQFNENSDDSTTDEEDSSWFQKGGYDDDDGGDDNNDNNDKKNNNND